MITPAELYPTASTEALGHLLACLDRAIRLMVEAGFDLDAVVVEAHRANLSRGREWPGDLIVSPFPPDPDS